MTIDQSRPATLAFALTSILFAVLLAPSPVRADAPIITEFMADNNETISLAGVGTPDWIELHNPGITTIDLAGWHLTDNEADTEEWTFPAGATIAPGAYLLVYASGLDTIGPGGEYHTNFRLFDQGEYLALVQPDGTVAQEFGPPFPEQYSDVSYGLPPGQTTYGYFTVPTPGTANNSSVQGFVKDTTFSHKRGFYEDLFQLEVTTNTPGATIYYTTNRSTPGPTSLHVDAPDPESPPVLSLDISRNTIVRAYAAKPGHVSTNIDTQTYLFLDEVIGRRNMSRTITQDPVWGPQMRDALLDIPSISLVTQAGIPTEPIMSPPEIATSIEMFFPDGRDGFQADVGIERFGGQWTVYPKHALRVSFKEIYGPKRLKFDLFSDTPYGGDTVVDSFDQILLRNGSHDSIFDGHYSHSRGAYIRNRYFFDRQIEAGHLSMRGKFVHVYLNGSYYGHYHLMERPNADFMATHLGGEEEDYDIMKGRGGVFVQQGTNTAWNHLKANLGNWAIVQDYMDLDSYIDYMLLNFYGGNKHDWYPSHNWVAGRKREAGGKFVFFMWDNDFCIRRGGSVSTGSTADVTGHGGPDNLLFQNGGLMQHDEFKMRLADRAQKHFFNDGMLTKERVKADITELGQRISRTIIPETARWAKGAVDFNADPPPPLTPTTLPFQDPDDIQGYIDWIVDVNAETRTDVVIGQMRSAGMFPDLEAPSFNQHGGFVGPSTPITMASDANRVYYTLDGSDPRLPGGMPNPDAVEVTLGRGVNVTTPVYFSAATLVRARSYNTSGSEWSALNEASFLVGIPATPDNLVISKIHYHPSVAQGDLAEYVELMNISDQAVNLSGLAFSEGITFSFGDRDTLLPGQRAVLVADATAFDTAYGAGATILGTYTARLANNGERLTLSGSDGLPLQTLRYNDKAPWPTEADGDGYSLVLIAPESAPDHELPENWRASVHQDGSPGTGDSIPFEGDPETDLLEYALGDPEALASRFIDGELVLDYPRVLGADDASVAIEVSSDLITWDPAEPLFLSQSERVGDTSVMRWSLAPNGSDCQFVRLVVSLNE